MIVPVDWRGKEITLGAAVIYGAPETDVERAAARARVVEIASDIRTFEGTFGEDIPEPICTVTVLFDDASGTAECTGGRASLEFEEKFPGDEVYEIDDIEVIEPTPEDDGISAAEVAEKRAEYGHSWGEIAERKHLR